MNATNQDIQAAERRLPLIGNSCTITTMVAGLTTVGSTLPLSSTRDGDRQQSTTLPVISGGSSSSDGVGGSTTTDESSNDQFLSLSLTKFILLVVILAVMVIAVFIVITVICCCCLYVQRVRSQAEINHAEGNYY